MKHSHNTAGLVPECLNHSPVEIELAYIYKWVPNSHFGYTILICDYYVYTEEALFNDTDIEPKWLIEVG